MMHALHCHTNVGQFHSKQCSQDSHTLYCWIIMEGWLCVQDQYHEGILRLCK